LPWTTLTGEAAAPGILGRIGPITAGQARQLARLGACNHATQWRVILVSADGAAIAVSRIPRRRPSGKGEPAGPAGPGRTAARSPGRKPATGHATLAEPAPGEPLLAEPLLAEPAPIIGRVTVIMPADGLDPDPHDAARRDPDPRDPDPRDPDRRDSRLHDPELADMRVRIIAAARRARDTARRLARLDADTPGGCAHVTASSAYRPPPRVAERVIARDQTCRNPRCRQPAWRADLDHTRPHHRGGLTCECNLGGLCRACHRLKQHPGWALTQPRPGIFQWTTPAGRTYGSRPDQHYAR
jgi:hypothetical protein